MRLEIIYEQGNPVEKYTFTAHEMRQIYSAISLYFKDLDFAYLSKFINELNTISRISELRPSSYIMLKYELHEAAREISTLVTKLKNSPFPFDKDRNYSDEDHIIIDPRNQYFNIDSFLRHLVNIPGLLNQRIAVLEPFRTKKGFSSMIYSSSGLPTNEPAAIQKNNEGGFWALVFFGAVFIVPIGLYQVNPLDVSEQLRALADFLVSMNLPSNKEVIFSIILSTALILVVGMMFGLHHLSLALSAKQVDYLVTQLERIKKEFDEHIAPQSLVAKLDHQQFEVLGFFSDSRAKQLKQFPQSADLDTEHEYRP